MKKRMIAVCCMLTMVGALVAGCGASTDGTSDSGNKTETTTKSQKAQRGTITENKYKNEAFGVSVSLPETAEFCSDEKIVGMLNLDTEILNEDGGYDADEMIDTMEGVLYDSIALLSDRQSNVVIAYEDLAKTGSKSQTEKQYAQKLVEEMESMEAMGYETDGVTEETINGTTFTTVKSSVGEIYQSYYMKKDGNYMIVFMSTFTPEMAQEEAEFMQEVTCK